MNWKIWAILGALLAIIMTGCIREKNMNNGQESKNQKEKQSKESLKLARSYQDLYENLQQEDQDILEFQEQVIRKIGDQGYAAVDNHNSINMVNYGQVEEFCRRAKKEEKADITLISVTDDGGFIRYDLESEDGRIDVTVSSLRWNKGEPEIYYDHKFQASVWKYTKKGYFFFEEDLPAGYDGAPGQKAFRVKPLDDACREACRQYVSWIGYERNNLLITDWDETDCGQLDFYDMYDRLAYAAYGDKMPYPAYEGAQYEIPEKEVEELLQSCFRFDSQTIQKKMVFHQDTGTYQYRPRGIRDGGYPYGPYPEVTSIEVQEDQTIRLTVEGVWTIKMQDCAVKSELVVRPIGNGEFQFVSNHVLSKEEEGASSWYKPRLTEEEWNRYYGEQEK